MTPARASSPAERRSVVLLLDSLNRHLIGPYGGDRVRHAEPRPVRTSVGALRPPLLRARCRACPARHDILCGALDFLWKPWGSIELWEEPLTVPLRGCRRDDEARHRPPAPVRDGRRELPRRLRRLGLPARPRVATRGAPVPIPSWMGAPSFGRGHMPYDDSRGWFRDESDFPGPRTMAAAARWLTDEAPAHERFLLFVDEFDPHEPFDTPEPYASHVRRRVGGPAPHVAAVPRRRAGRRRDRRAREARQIRASYGAKLTMIDAWLGRVLDVLDAQDRWARHRGDPVHRPRPLPRREGHLGQARRAGLRAARPHAAADRVARASSPGAAIALTTAVDLHATLLDLFGASERAPHPRPLARPAARGRRRLGARARAVRHLGPRGAPDRRRRRAQVRPRARRRERAAVDVVEPLVDDAGALDARVSDSPVPTTAPRSTACPARRCR